jgi:hypothetical protein
VKSLDELIGLAAELHSKLKAAPAGGAGGEAIAELSQRLRDSLAGAEELHDGLVFEAVGRRILDATAPARGGPAFERMRALSPADRRAVFLGAPEERDAVLKKAGFTEAEIRELVDGMERFRKK